MIRQERQEPTFITYMSETSLYQTQPKGREMRTINSTAAQLRGDEIKEWVRAACYAMNDATAMLIYLFFILTGN